MNKLIMLLTLLVINCGGKDGSDGKDGVTITQQTSCIYADEISGSERIAALNVTSFSDGHDFTTCSWYTKYTETSKSMINKVDSAGVVECYLPLGAANAFDEDVTKMRVFVFSFNHKTKQGSFQFSSWPEAAGMECEQF